MADPLATALLLYVASMYGPASYYSYRVWQAGGFSRAWLLILMGDALVPMAFWAALLLGAAAGSALVPMWLLLGLFVAMPTLLVAGLWQLWNLVREIGPRR